MVCQDLGLVPIKRPAADVIPPGTQLIPEFHTDGEIRAVARGEIGGRAIIAIHHRWSINVVYGSFWIDRTIVTSPAPPWPMLRMTPIKRLASMRTPPMGVRPRRGGEADVGLDHDGFRRAYRVRTDSPDFAVAMLDLEAQEFLAEHPGDKWYVMPGAISIVQDGKMNEKRLRRGVERMAGLLPLLPPELEEWID